MNAQPETREIATLDTARPETSAIISVIERAALNPAVDIDKMERLLAMQERILARDAEQSFNEALNKAQADLGPVAADASNPQTKSRYASYVALDRAIRPVYGRHGFSLSFDTGETAAPEHIRVTCYVAHSAGHSRTYHVDMPADGKGAKGGDVMTKTHAVGAAMSYGQRYLLKLIFNIAVGEDRDGNGHGSARDQSAAASAAIAAINAVADLADLKTWKIKNAEGLKAMPSEDHDAIVRAFNDRFARLREGAPQ
jgi:hypothetical protein